jgi:hypothetical protein
VEDALSALHLETRYAVERIVFWDDRRWCARLRAGHGPDTDLSVCIEWDDLDLAGNVARFQDKVARYLAFGGAGVAAPTRGDDDGHH